MPLTAQAKTNIQSHLDEATAKSNPAAAPGLAFTAVNRKGEALTEQYSGVRSNASNKPIDADTIFWLASCTKIVTAIACMQLAEQGRLDLDSPAQLYTLVPELAAKREVYVAPGTWEPRRGDISVRMLLSHTAGFGYTFFNERLLAHGRPVGLDEFSGDFYDIAASPLVNQPGSRWEYGTSIDWAGVAVERLTHTKLGDYMQKHIFAPLDVHDTAMAPDRHMRAHLASVHQRLPGGATVEANHPLRRALAHADDRAVDIFHSGGAGLFSSPRQFGKILAALLNDGASAATGARILRPDSVAAMFTNQIPQFPRFAWEPIPAAQPLQTNPLPALYAQEGAPDQAWGISMHMTVEPGATGRGRNTGWWAGIVNLFWWCDREKGVAGMLAGALFPFGDPTVMGTWAKCEAETYAGLG